MAQKRGQTRMHSTAVRQANRDLKQAARASAVLNFGILWSTVFDCGKAKLFFHSGMYSRHLDNGQHCNAALQENSMYEYWTVGCRVTRC